MKYFILSAMLLLSLNMASSEDAGNTWTTNRNFNEAAPLHFDLDLSNRDYFTLTIKIRRENDTFMIEDNGITGSSSAGYSIPGPSGPVQFIPPLSPGNIIIHAVVASEDFSIVRISPGVVFTVH